MGKGKGRNQHELEGISESMNTYEMRATAAEHVHGLCTAFCDPRDVVCHFTTSEPETVNSPPRKHLRESQQR